MTYLKYPTRHRVIVYMCQPCLFLLSDQPGPAEEVCECLCSRACTWVSVIISECRAAQEILYPGIYSLMLAFFFFLFWE